jgi:hypothetical protein
MRLSDKVKNLRRKEQQFRANGDFSRATHCKIVADFLEDYVRGCALETGKVVIEICEK